MLEQTMSPQIDALAAALAKAQASFPIIKKESKAEIRSARGNYEYHYASLSAVLEAIRGPLGANGITYTQPIEQTDSSTFVLTLLLHSSGQWLCSRFKVPTTDLIGPQAIGSYIAYARRYAITSLTGVAIEDDDGKAAQRQAERQEAAPARNTQEPGCDDQPSRPNERGPRTVAKPRTGEWLAQAATKQGLVDEFFAIGEKLGYPLSLRNWTPSQVASAIEVRKERLTQ